MLYWSQSCGLLIWLLFDLFFFERQCQDKLATIGTGEVKPWPQSTLFLSGVGETMQLCMWQTERQWETGATSPSRSASGLAKDVLEFGCLCWFTMKEGVLPLHNRIFAPQAPSLHMSIILKYQIYASVLLPCLLEPYNY